MCKLPGQLPAQDDFHFDFVETAGDAGVGEHKIHQFPAFCAESIQLFFRHLGAFHHFVFPLLHGRSVGGGVRGGNVIDRINGSLGRFNFVKWLEVRMLRASNGSADTKWAGHRDG